MRLSEACVEHVGVSAYTIPTDGPEADGTLAWNSTTLVLAEVRTSQEQGLGYTYGNSAIAAVGKRLGEKCLLRKSAFDIPALHASMLKEVRNDGSRGIGAMAISALDIALWDLKARLLECPVADLLGRSQPSVAVYGSGGFTSYTDAQLTEQLSGWVDDGIRMVKMKVGSNAADDPRRVRVARQAIGADTDLFVDANGAYAAKEAITLAERFAECDVSWFEEPVSSDHLADLHRVREAVRPPMEVAAGECSRQKQWTYCNSMPRDAEGSPAFLRRRQLPGVLDVHSPRIARLRCICMWAAQCQTSAISNISTITFVSKRCCSMGTLGHTTGGSSRTGLHRDWALLSNARMPNATPSEALCSTT
jgi:hypothetical protein